VTEETACRPVDEYETTKMRVEARILEKAGAAFEVVMMRPAAIFGPGGQNLVSLADNLRSRSEVVNYLKACLCGGRRMNLVSVHNVVAAIEFLIDASDRVDREIFIVSDDEPEKNNYRFVEGFIKKSFGLGGYGVPILPIPPCVLDAFLRLAGKSNSDSSRAYSGRKLKDLGFKRAIEFDAALGEFAEWRKSVIA
jgi:nucleoside-diphosphate-sugar epimerase